MRLIEEARRLCGGIHIFTHLSDQEISEQRPSDATPRSWRPAMTYRHAASWIYPDPAGPAILRLREQSPASPEKI